MLAADASGSEARAREGALSTAVPVPAEAGPIEDGVKPAPAGADTAGGGVGCLVERAEVLKRAIEELEEKPHQQPQPQFHQQPQPHLPQQPQLQPPQPQPPQVTSPPPSPPMHLNCVSSLLSPASSTTYFHPGAGAWLCPCIQCMDRRLGMLYAVMG